MSVKTYSLSRDGATKLSPHFCVREFKCAGTDVVKVSEETVAALELIRAHFGKPVDINSGFRIPMGTSQHTLGKAADFRIAGVNPRDIARWCEENLWAKGIITGLGLYDYKPGDKEKEGFVHIDVGTGSTRPCQWIQLTSTAGKETVVGSITRDHLGGTAPGTSAARPTLRQGSKGEDVKYLQGRLIAKGQLVGIDGSFGPQTLAAVNAVQKAAGLTVDGVVGAKTWGALEG